MFPFASFKVFPASLAVTLPPRIGVLSFAFIVIGIPFVKQLLLLKVPFCVVIVIIVSVLPSSLSGSIILLYGGKSDCKYEL